MNQINFFIDIIAKYIALFMVLFYMGLCVENYLSTGNVINMPDWIIMVITLIVQYFFRRSPKKE